MEISEEEYNRNKAEGLRIIIPSFEKLKRTREYNEGETEEY